MAGLRIGPIGDIWFSQSGTGASQRAVEEKLREFVSVKDFKNDDDTPVAGDGVQDDSTGIQAAIDSVATGGTVYFPPGTYYVGSSLDVAKYPFLVLRGAGAGYPIGSAAGASEIVTDQAIYIIEGGDNVSVNHKGCAIQDLGFRDTSGAGTALGAVRMTRTNRNRFERVSAGDFTGGTAFIFEPGGDSCVEPMLLGCQVRNCLRGIYSNGFTTAMTVLGGSYVGSSIAGGVAVEIYGSSQVLGAALDGWETAVVISNNHNFVRTRIEGCTNGLVFESGARNVATGCIFINCTNGVTFSNDATQQLNELVMNHYSGCTNNIVNNTLANRTLTIDEPSIGYVLRQYGEVGVGNKFELYDIRSATGEGSYFQATGNQGAYKAVLRAYNDGTLTGAFVGATTNHRAYLLANNEPNVGVQRKADMSSGETGLLVLVNRAGVFSLDPVTIGAADSGGAGYKVLRVPN